MKLQRDYCMNDDMYSNLTESYYYENQFVRTFFNKGSLRVNLSYLPPLQREPARGVIRPNYLDATILTLLMLL